MPCSTCNEQLTNKGRKTQLWKGVVTPQIGCNSSWERPRGRLSPTPAPEPGTGPPYRARGAWNSRTPLNEEQTHYWSHRQHSHHHGPGTYSQHSKSPLLLSPSSWDPLLLPLPRPKLYPDKPGKPSTTARHKQHPPASRWSHIPMARPALPSDRNPAPLLTTHLHSSRQRDMHPPVSLDGTDSHSITTLEWPCRDCHCNHQEKLLQRQPVPTSAEAALCQDGFFAKGRTQLLQLLCCFLLNSFSSHTSTTTTPTV